MSEETVTSSAGQSPPTQDGAANRRPGMVLVIVLALQTMLILDVNVVNIALPDLKEALDFTPTGLSWVLSSYLLTFGGLLLLGGRAGDVLGHRRGMLIGVTVFTLASLLGGLANSAGMLLAARALQGVGAAIAAPTVLALIATHFTDNKSRARALGLYAAVSGSGAAIGLIGGGLLTDWLSWRWVLFINVPIGIVLLIAAPMFIHETERKPARFDLGGALTSTVGMTALVYGFIRAAESGWGDTLTLGSFALAIVLLALFVFIETHAKQPITPLRLFADRNRATGYLSLLFVMAAGNAMFFFLTQFLQEVRGFTPIQAGLAFVPLAVLILAASSIAAKVLPKAGPRVLTAVGAAAISVGLIWFARITPEAEYVSALLGPMLVAGLGMGTLLVGVTTILMSGIAPEETGAASGLLNVMQQIGGALGLAIMVTVFGAASRGAADEVPAGLDAKGAADFVLTEGVTTAFAWGAGFTALTILLTLIMRTVPMGGGEEAEPAPEQGANPAREVTAP
ncbi:MFS transporter [Streptomyces atroolivaceus]|uniref:MFS transporter n=1 Tax=Streptomyces atroolivaceus TaxID=66869 RepID=UPI0020243B1A|nr:MFS transporter [Streptomyces atroolivaceus]